METKKIPVAVLFARKDSIYKQLGVEVYDIERDALSFEGGIPVICHPPCRAWGRLRHFAKPRVDEKELGLWAVDQVRKWGGCLEHPSGSRLWEEKNMPTGNAIDEFGGYTLDVDQFWWGHRAKKRTWLYIVGVEKQFLPEYPIRFDAVTHRIGGMRLKGDRKPLPEVTKKEREATPANLAQWLIKVASLVAVCPDCADGRDEFEPEWMCPNCR
jgi:hypothetical protein